MNNIYEVISELLNESHIDSSSIPGHLRTNRTYTMNNSLRWATMRAILMFHYFEGQSHNTVSTNRNPFVEKGEPKRNRTEVLLLTSLMPYR